MNAFKNRITEMTWTDERLSKFTLGELGQLQAYNGAGVFAISSVVEKFIKEFPWSSRNQENAISYLARMKKGELFRSFCFEETAWKFGQRTVYGIHEIALNEVGGGVKVVANEPVPLPVEEKHRFGVHAMAGIAGAFILAGDGGLKDAGASPQFQAAWGNFDSPIRVEKVPGLREIVHELIRGTQDWNNLSDQNKLSITKTKWVEFLINCLNHCDLKDYLALQFFVCHSFLRAFEEFGNHTERVKVIKDKKAYYPVPLSCFAPIPEGIAELDAAVNEVWGKDSEVPRRYYIGGVPAIHAFVRRDQTLGCALEAEQHGKQIRGQEMIVPYQIFQMSGFSGFTTATVKRICTVIGMAAGCLAKVNKLDISVSNFGDVPYIITSLKELGKPFSSDWKIFMSMSEISRLDPMWRSHVISAMRSDAHYLNCDMATMPNDPEKELRKHDHNWVPTVPCNGYTIYTPIWGSYAWEKPLSQYTKEEREAFDLQALKKKSFATRERPVQQHFVCTWRTSVKFEAIVTTLDNYSLWGRESEMDGNKIKDKWVSIPMKRFPTEQDWYDFVVDSNYSMNGSFLNVRAHYSPLSNVVTPTVKGVRYTMNKHGDWEEGTIVTSGGSYFGLDSDNLPSSKTMPKGISSPTSTAGALSSTVSVAHEVVNDQVAQVNEAFQ